MLTTVPRAAFRYGAAACTQRNGPIRLIDKSRCQNASVCASRSDGGIGDRVPGVAALLTR